jgi:hypothetical protein
VSNAASFTAALNQALPGDVITLANGVYGISGIHTSGTAANPIVIRGQSMAGVVLDGGGCTACNIFEVYGSYVHIENLTLENAQRAIRFQTKRAIGNVVRGVHIRNTQLGIGGRVPQFDFYIADNILEGRLQWPLTYSSDGGLHANDDGIAVCGYGMVVAHNRISGYGDAMKNKANGARAVDFYGNDVLWTYDNGVELDSGEGNIRAMRNRFTNNGTPLSVQPIHQGPAYILRNVVVNVVDEQVKFHNMLSTNGPEAPNGVFVYHNTFVSPGSALQVQTPLASHYFTIKNNLFLSQPGFPGRIVNWDAPIDHGTFDYNGYYPNGAFAFDWLSGFKVYPTFLALQSASVETHGVLLSGRTFFSGLIAPASYTVFMQPADAALEPGSPAIDRGLPLANINDGFQGAAPDLGALETGCPEPIYGPRPPGVDETNEPLGCAVP